MDKSLLQKNLYRACCAKAPQDLMLSFDLQKEIEDIQEYLGRKFNNLPISKELEDKINEIGFLKNNVFENWFNSRINFYKNKWEEMRKYEGEIINNYDFLSETFKILNKCSCWVQNAYQPFSRAKSDCIAAYLEKEEKNKEILKKKVESFCKAGKDWHGKDQQELNENEQEKERQIFAFFAELKAADELLLSGFTSIEFLQEGQNKTPDLLAQKEGENYFVEVKRIQNPREEDKALRNAKMHSGNVNKEFRKSLKKKIDDFICDAKEKFKKQDTNLKRKQKILFLDYEPGIDARLSVNFNATLVDIFGENYFSILEETHDITILPRKYF